MAFFVFSRSFFVISRGAFRFFVFSPGVISSFRYFAWRFFVISSFSLGVISSWRRAITPGEKTKERNNEMAQTSHHTNYLIFQFFLSSSIREWNNLPLDVRNSDSVFVLNVHWTLTLISSLDIPMLVIDMLRYFTPGLEIIKLFSCSTQLSM